jgi:uncharacterized protein YukE
MIDPRVLKFFKTDDAQLRTFFTSKGAGKGPAGEDTPADELFEKKVEFMKWVAGLIEDGRNQCFDTYRHITSTSLMLDSQPTLPENIPLMAYAQGKIDVTVAEKELKALGCADKFVEKRNCAKEGEAEKIKTDVNVARLHEVCVNVGRSLLARRANAQTNKYGPLRPFFKYETRGTSMVDHLRADAFSQYAEIIVDSYNYRHIHDQCVHAMFASRTFLFPAGAWDVATQTQVVPKGFSGSSQEIDVEGEPAKLRIGTVVEREGVIMSRPSSARCFYDTSHAPSTLNADIGCRYVGFFDVQRYGDVRRNPNYFNTDRISWNSSGRSVLDNNRAYFDLVFAGQPINFPNAPVAALTTDIAAANERTAQSFTYRSGSDDENAVFVTDIRVKVIPKEWGMGEYMHPVWLRLLVASDDTVVFAEWLPSLPAIYWGHGEDDTRLLNITMAHEIMPWQDQLSNIFSQLLLKMKHALLRIIIINTDIVPKAIVTELRNKLNSPKYYIEPHLLEVSLNEVAKEHGLDIANAIRIIGAGEGTNANESEYINNAFKAIIQILAIMERLLNMSPQEQGQPAPREITAEEVAAIESTTQATFNAISASIDKARAAWKRLIYESAMAYASNVVPLPIAQRFSRDTIAAAGFTVVEDPAGEAVKSTARRGHTVLGTFSKLAHNYVFSSRDGGDRASNREAANVLQQFLIGLIPQIGPEAIGKKRIFDIINEIFRLLSSYDLKLEMNDDETDSITSPEAQKQMASMQEQFAAHLQKLQEVLQEHENEISSVTDAVEKIGEVLRELRPAA